MGAISMGMVNYLAVAVSALVTFMLGGMWYELLVKKAWVKAHGFSEEDVKELQARRSPATFFGGMVISYFVLAFVMAVIFSAGSINTALAGAGWGLVFWIAFAALKMTDHIASGKRLLAFEIDASFQLIAMVVTGAIVGGWN
jgi:hypothetical protein